MPAQCSATKRDGSRCTLPATGQHGLCWAHNPENAEKRRKGASRGGRAKANREVIEVKRLVRGLVAGVLNGRTDRADAAVVNQLLQTQLKALEMERKIRETDDLAREIEELKREHGVA